MVNKIYRSLLIVNLDNGVLWKKHFIQKSNPLALTAVELLMQGPCVFFFGQKSDCKKLLFVLRKTTRA
jgi:hypothetical protein